jgi:phosphate acyltransferase
MRIAVDAMGADHGPGVIVAGALEALHQIPQMHLILVGNEEVLKPLVPTDIPSDRISFFHCTQAIEMNDSPVEGMRKKPDNSILRSWQLLAEKKADAIVSAGNTGAVVAGGLRLRKFLPHVKRPGIGTLMPTAKGPCLIVDVGANVGAKPYHLLQYAAMGLVYAREILKREKPTIGLLNVGEEEGKGNDLAKETYDLLKASPLKEHFIGNIEGRDIHRGACDVVVCDGFTGNIVLKLSEGVFDFVMKVVGKEIVMPLPNDQAVGMQAIHNTVGKYHYSNFGGAPLLGIDGNCIICHGSSKETAIRNAVGVASKLIQNELNKKMTAELEALPRPGTTDE